MNNIATGISAPLPHHPPVDAVQDLAELNQQITAAVVDALQAGRGLSPELAAIIEARDALIARLSRLDE